MGRIGCELKVNCKLDNDKFCGKCCHNTEMPLLISDILRIEALGFKREYFVVYRNGVPRLRNVNGRCVFLSGNNACTIYRHRPLGCRLYPLVYDVSSNRVVIDDLCPKRDEIKKKVLPHHRRCLLELLKELGVFKR